MRYFILLSAALASPAATQATPTTPTIAREAKTAAGFVPSGWQIVSKAEGDLDGDKAKDVALVLGLARHPDGSPGTIQLSEDCYTAPSVIVVARAQAGGYRTLAINDRLYPRNCELSVPDVQIRKGVLIVNHNWRDGWAIDTTHRFRMEPSGKLMLIGYDFERYSRSSLTAGTKTSENYLAGLRIEYAKKDQNAYSELKRARITHSQVPFARAALIEVEDGDVFRPF